MSMKEKIRILFVCHGNICRSPMAEFILKDMAKKQGISDRLTIASAATSSEEIWGDRGNPVYPPAKAELAAHGISCDGKYAVQLRTDDYSKYDLFIGMDSANIRNMHRTGWLPMAVSIAIYGGLSAANPIQAVEESLLNTLTDSFSLSLWTVVPAVLVPLMSKLLALD